MPEACNFIKKLTLAQVFSCEFCKISENTFFTEHLRTTVSVTKPTFELQIFHVIMTFLQSSEAVTGGALLEKVFLKISQIS